MPEETTRALELPEATPAKSVGYEFSKDGRRKLAEPCEFGHRYQAMECPSCSERITGTPASAEHWDWYRSRTMSKQKAKVYDARKTKGMVR